MASLKTVPQRFVSSKFTWHPESPLCSLKTKSTPTLISSSKFRDSSQSIKATKPWPQKDFTTVLLQEKKDPQRTHTSGTSANIHWRSTFGVNTKTKNDCFSVIRHPLKEGRRVRNSDNCNLSHGMKIMRALWRPKTTSQCDAPASVQGPKESNWDTNKSRYRRSTKCTAESMLSLQKRLQ